MLQTDTRVGLTEQEVLARRKKYGLNQMKEEKESKFTRIRALQLRQHLATRYLLGRQTLGFAKDDCKVTNWQQQLN